jgi:hypothetical protein
MRRIAFAFSLILALTILVANETRAQTVVKADNPSGIGMEQKGPRPVNGVFQKVPVIVAQPTAEQKAKLAELAKTWENQARAADNARDKYLIQLMATLAELGLKPSETSVTWNDKGEPIFNRIEPTTAKTEAKPEAKP